MGYPHLNSTGAGGAGFKSTAGNQPEAGSQKPDSEESRCDLRQFRRRANCSRPRRSPRRVSTVPTGRCDHMCSSNTLGSSDSMGFTLGIHD